MKKISKKTLNDKECDNKPQPKVSQDNEIVKQIAVETARDTEKLFKNMGRNIKNIWSIFIDPTRLAEALKINKLDSIYELFLRDERLMKVLALIVAAILAISARYAPNIQERYSVDINGYELIASYDKERMVIEGLPDTVDVTLVGDKNQVDIAKTKESFEILADLTDLPPGTHKVNLGYSKIGEKIDVKINPSTIVVNIMELTESDEELNHEFVNESEIDEMYVLNPPKLAVDSVKVKGPQEVVDQVAIVKAIIDVSDLTKLVDYEAPVYAYDKNGDKLDVEIKPDKVHTTVEVTSPSKVIPIEAIITGNPPEGNSVSSISLTPSEVKIYGETEALELIDKLNIQLDLYQLDDNQELIIKLDKPETVHKMDAETVKIKVSFEKTQTKELKDVTIDYQNLDKELSIKAQSVEEATVDISLKGSESLLNGLKPDDINVYIDLAGYGVGEHEVPITFEPIAGVIAELKKPKINVIITK